MFVIPTSDAGKLGGVRQLIKSASKSYFMKIFPIPMFTKSKRAVKRNEKKVFKKLPRKLDQTRIYIYFFWRF